jgi:tetratricopeptide (TPR) repeat protein
VSSLSLFEGFLGKPEESIRLSKLAVELDPLNPEAHLNHGKVLIWANQLDKSFDALNRAIELSPNMTSAYLMLCWVFLLQGKPDEAKSAIEKEISDGYKDCGLTMVYHAKGLKEESDQDLERLLTNDEQWGAQFAYAYAYRNERDKAFEWLERSVELQDSGILPTKVSPLLSNLHSDPRWPVILKKIGLSG